MGTPRITLQAQLVLRTLLEDPSREMYGLEIATTTGLPPGTIHPILARFEGIGWLESHFEQVDPHEVGRPRRRYYRFTHKGADLACSAIAKAQAKRQGLSRFIPDLPGSAG